MKTGQVKSQRHSDCSDQYSVLGDFEHPASLEDSLKRGEYDGNQKMGQGGRVGKKREDEVRLRRGRDEENTSDLDFVIDVTQTEPKSMSLQVINIVNTICHNFV